MSVTPLVSVAALAAFTGLLASVASASITIPTVPVAIAPNDADPTTGYGAVAYAYNIGATEVTNAQYAAFLNAKAASDPNDLYDTRMTGALGGITRSGSPGSYSYATVTGRGNHPVNFVSFWDATRFANWLHNGQGNSDTESGAYTLGGVTNPANTITRNPDWRWAVTSEDEWYKAAYHQPSSLGGDADNYWLYPTASNTISTSQANYSSPVTGTTPVGTYAANFYGTFDMGGNVSEWNEAPGTGYARGLRGGSFSGASSMLQAGTRNTFNPASGSDGVGFRVVVIPAPSSVALLALSGLMISRRRR